MYDRCRIDSYYICGAVRFCLLLIREKTIMTIDKFLSDEQIEQIQVLCQQAAAGPKDKPAYVIIEIINDHPRNFMGTQSVKPIIPEEVLEKYKHRYY